MQQIWDRMLYTTPPLGGDGLLRAALETENIVVETLHWPKRQNGSRKHRKNGREAETVKGKHCETENGRNGQENHPKFHRVYFLDPGL